jgi:hypothetical protein
MFTVLTSTRNSKLYIIVALTTALIGFLTFAVVPSIVAPEPASIPITGSEVAYAQYLKGEKLIYIEVDLSLPLRPDFSHLSEENVAPSSYRSPTDECFDVPLRELAQCHSESERPSQ